MTFQLLYRKTQIYFAVTQMPDYHKCRLNTVWHLRVTNKVTGSTTKHNKIAFQSKANHPWTGYTDMFLLLWPWPSHDDLDIRTLPRYFTVLPFQVKCSKFRAWTGYTFCSSDLELDPTNLLNKFLHRYSEDVCAYQKWTS